MQTPVSRLKVMSLPSGVVTTQFVWVWVNTMYPLASSIDMEITFTIPFLFNYTWKSLYVPFILVTIVPELHLPFIVALLFLLSVRNSSEKKV